MQVRQVLLQAPQPLGGFEKKLLPQGEQLDPLQPQPAVAQASDDAQAPQLLAPQVLPAAQVLPFQSQDAVEQAVPLKQAAQFAALQPTPAVVNFQLGVAASARPDLSAIARPTATV